MWLQRIVDAIEAVLGLAFAVGLAGFAVYFFVVKPMARNYAECGTVFLCSAQP